MKPLEGIRVLDLGQIYNVPYCTLLMAYLGAEVIKLEPVNGGEHLRKRLGKEGAQFPFLMLNNNKKCITLNLKHPKGKDIFLKLSEKVDVLIQNFSNDVMERLGLGYEQLHRVNPKLIYASGVGFGSDSVYRDLPAMDLTIQALSGIMSITGFADRPPVKAGPAIADFMGGIHLFGGVLAALFRRERTGEGDWVEVAMMDSVYASLASSLGYYFGKGEVPPRTGNRHSGLAEAPYNVYPTRDGYIAIFCVNDRHWGNLVKVMGRPDLEHHVTYATIPGRIQHMDEIDEMIAEWTKGFNREDLFHLLADHHVPCAPVNDLDDIHKEGSYYSSRGMILQIDHPTRGKVTVPGNPIRLKSMPRLDIIPTPELGQHNWEIYHGLLHIREVEFEKLVNEGVI